MSFLSRLPDTEPPSGIKDLHDKGVLHRDISTTNIMITVDGRGRLIDLDLARDLKEVGARHSVRTVSRLIWKDFWVSGELISSCDRAHGNSCQRDYSPRLERSTNCATISNRSGLSSSSKASTSSSTTNPAVSRW